MVDKLLKIFSFLNLLDQSKKISLTNLAMYSVLIKILISPLDWSAAVSLFVVALNYSHKRKTISDQSKSTQEVDTKIAEAISASKAQMDDLQSKVNAAMLKVGLK